jgi:hypothetical protein
MKLITQLIIETNDDDVNEETREWLKTLSDEQICKQTTNMYVNKLLDIGATGFKVKGQSQIVRENISYVKDFEQVSEQDSEQVAKGE